MLNITDINQLKITKVKDWSICFDYEGDHYLLHGRQEYGEIPTNELFKKTLDNKGKYNLSLIESCYGEEDVSRCYIKIQIDDIGYSDKVVLLGVNYHEAKDFVASRKLKA